MRRTSRCLRAVCLGFFVAALVAQGACASESAMQCSGDSFSVDLTDMEAANLGQDVEERTEQLRDWLWPLLLARLEVRGNLAGLLVGSAAVPLIRDDALAHAMDLPVGSTRAGTAEDGTVVVMVQEGDEAAMQEAVLEAIDQEMMHLGKVPRQAVVYRYAIDERAGYADMCTIGTFDADWLKSRSQGFRHATLETTADLESFLDGGVDLLSAQCTESGLRVTGRTRPRARMAPITTEHVASLAPASVAMQNSAGPSIGFSLDPKLPAREAVKDLETLQEALHDPTMLAVLLHLWNAEPMKAADLVQILEQTDSLLEPTRERLSALKQELAARGDRGALGVLSQAEQQKDTPANTFAASLASVVAEHSAYQCARYDGPLQGTLTGMTMFYTDLLMKLWSADAFDLAPEGLIPGFQSVVGHELSSADCAAEADQSHWTRAWLGLWEEQHVLHAADRVRFAPMVTRMFARGSQHGPDHSEEVEASAAMHRFYRWWNAHYARVAAWEPQYELLNQIMKWSVVTHLAAQSEHEGCLGFLDQIRVDRSHRFDQWVDEHEELRWHGPVPLVQRDGEPTECLPLLRWRSYSSCIGEGYLTGGISLLKKVTTPSKPVDPVPDARELVQLGAISSRMPSVSYWDRIEYDFIARADGKLPDDEIDPARKTFRARLDATQSQRGARHRYVTDQLGEQRAVTGLKNERRLRQRQLSASDALEAGDSTWGVAHLHADEVTSSMLRPKVTPAPVVQMRAIGDEAAARLAGDRESLPEIALDLPGVTSAYELPDGTVLLELSHAAGDSPGYGLMSSGEGNRGPPGALTIRFGRSGTQDTDGTVEIALLPDAAAQPLLAQATKLPGQQAELMQIAQALDANDLASAERAIRARMTRGGHHAAVTKVIAQAHRQAVRQGGDPRAIEALQLRTSIEYGKPRTPLREYNVFPADGTDFLVPRSHAHRYADLANLPPGQNPATRPGEPRLAFSARALQESPTLSQVPSEVHVNDVDYVRVQRPVTMIQKVRRATYIIKPCRRDGEKESSGTSECRGRTTAQQAEEAQRQRLHRQACRNQVVAKAFGLPSCGQGRP